MAADMSTTEADGARGRYVLLTMASYAAAILLCGIAVVYVHHDDERLPIADAGRHACMGALFALALTGMVAYGLSDKFVWTDVVRMGCWVLMGAALGVGTLGGSYYEFWDPDFARRARLCCQSGLLLGLTTIVAVTARSWFRRKRSKAPHGPDQ